ncbi:MAG: NACHT domain-containing protein [Blastocatellia bacterium]|nr:NACHT domain-containing protein [Blastocatellia bacterium]
MTSILKKNIEGDYKLLLSWRYNIVEFLGLPSLKENRPLTLEEIYVPLSFTWEPGGRGERFYLPAALKASRQLVVLGDPGSGKSTLVKLITHSFGRAAKTPLARNFGPLVPVPIILRDYRVRNWKSKEDMLSDFISQLDEEVRDSVTVEWLLAPLREGRGFLLIDGLDEVGSRQDRLHLRDKIIYPLLAEMPESYAILTSRIIGYDEVPFAGSSVYEAAAKGTIPPLSKFAETLNRIVSEAPLEVSDLYEAMAKPQEVPFADFREDLKTALLQRHLSSLRQCYVAPFNDEDIEQFIARWYGAREPDTERRRIGMESLGRALNQNDRIKRLATNPSLLTLMALIHRVMNLPSGRVKLYDKIVEAYLETIQTYRKLKQYPASLDQMKRWLARVGWEMQTHRARDEKEDLLVSKEQVLKWLAEEIAIDRPSPEEEAEQFLDYVARRSGLLIPRGPAQFSFVHLTFQEYFAAFHLRGQLGRFDRLAANCANLVKERHWHETLSLLFEMLAEFPGAGDDLLGELINKAESDSDIREGAAELFAALLLDEHSGLSLSRQKEAAEFALALACDDYNESVIMKLKELPLERFDSWVALWMNNRLDEAESESIGRDFFIVGNELLKDLTERLGKWVTQRGDLMWTEEQIEDITLVAGESVEVCDWAAQRLPLTAWLLPLVSFYYLWEELSLAELNFPTLSATSNQSPRHRLLIQSSLAVGITNSQIIKQITSGLDRSLDRFLARTVAQDQRLARAQALARSLARSRSRSQAWGLARAQARAWGLAQAGVVVLSRNPDPDLALALIAAISSPRPEQMENHGDIAALMAEAEWLFFSPDASSDEFNSTINSLRKLTEAKDDWTRLLALSSLLLLGAGTPQMCAERNALLDKGILHSKEFSFPQELHPETETDAFRKELPEVLRIAFLHDPEEPWLTPEKFDPSNPDSRYFLSPPREFFAIAAEVLDPEGKTELAKWRKR